MTNADQPFRKNLYLAGFMGTGKSALGRHLAERWRRPFYDSDACIEQKAGMSIPDLFAKQGEAAFRAMEKDFIEDGHPAEGCVVSLGGGLVVQPGMIDRLKAKGVLVCLFASPETILQRTRGNSNRPLLNVPDPEKHIRDLMAQREPYYLQAGTGIVTDGRTMLELLTQIERIYRRHARESGIVG